MGVVTDQGASNLTGPVTATALTIPVANGLLFKAFNIPVVEGEKVLVCSVTPTALTICPNGRGLDGTVAAPHASGKPIYNLVHQTYPNRSRLEIEALEHIWFNGGDATIVNGLIRLTRATPFYSGVFTSQTSVVIPAGVHQQGCAIIAAAYDSAGRAILAGIGVDSSCNVTFTFATAQSGSYVIIGGGGTGISTNATQIQGVNIVNTAPVTNQFLFYNGTSWAPQFIDSSVLADTADIMRTTASATTGAFTYDFSGAAHTLPAKKGLVSALPAQCTVGEEYFATDAAAGSNKYYCTTSNIWTQQTGGGGGGGVSAVSGTSPIVSSGGSTPAISCPTCLVRAHRNFEPDHLFGRHKPGPEPAERSEYRDTRSTEPSLALRQHERDRHNSAAGHRWHANAHASQYRGHLRRGRFVSARSEPDDGQFDVPDLFDHNERRRTFGNLPGNN
jgi:hypothetical protein